jgi:oligopeptide transport system permease protein
MLKFILRRCLEAIPTLFILITISFFMMRLAPGSPFTGERTLPPEVMANIEAKYHLNDPIHPVLQLSEAAGARRFWTVI